MYLRGDPKLCTGYAIVNTSVIAYNYKQNSLRLLCLLIDYNRGINNGLTRAELEVLPLK